jgi:gas vesicle protein
MDTIALFRLEEKMYRGFIIVLIMQLGFFIHGCTTLEYIDGSSKEELKKFKMSKYGMIHEMEKVKADNVNLQRQIDILNTLVKEKQRILDEKESTIAGLKGKNEDEVIRLREENELLSEQIKNVTKENQKVKYENKSLVKILTRQKGTLLSQSNALKKYIQKLKIKVLSIDSKNSAEKMAKKLAEIGYDIKSVSYAPQSKFSRNTVYFTQEFKDEAEQLVVSLGGNTTFKPLNWPSVFDLIVVTGENH